MRPVKGFVAVTHCRCDTMHAQQQLQRQFEAQFLHKPADLKAKLKSQLVQHKQQQQQLPQQLHQRQATAQEAALQWTHCMPAVRSAGTDSGLRAGDTWGGCVWGGGGVLHGGK